VCVTPQGTIRMTISWGAPHGGTSVDELSIDVQGRLRISTTMRATVGDKSVTYCQVYDKQR
jgi:hypothetical protein